MVSKITLENVKLVLSGDLDAEDNKWDLIARGAYAMDSVTKTTGALIAGNEPKAKHLAQAKKHGTPILGASGLRALLDGASLQQAIAGDATAATAAAAPVQNLGGLRVVIGGTFAGNSRASLAAALEIRGAKVAAKPSSTTDLLLVGNKPSVPVIEAMDAGVPFLRKRALDAVLGGAPLSDFLGARGPEHHDPEAAMLEIVERVRAELETSPGDDGEAWDDELELTLGSNGRLVAKLRDLGGTPLHDHVREVLQRQSWPEVTAAASLRVAISFRA